MSAAAGQEAQTFVVYAKPSARRRAVDLGFEGVLENAVRDAIRAGSMRRRPFRGFAPLGEGERLVLLGDLVARTAKGEQTPSGRRRLLVLDVVRAPRFNNHRKRRSMMGSRTQERPKVVHVTENHPVARAARTVKDALGVETPVEQLFERLDDAERSRLAALCEKLCAAPRPIVDGEVPILTVMEPQPYRPGPSARARAIAYAEAIESLPARRPHVRERAALVAAFARDRQRVPSDRERAVLLGARSGQTLDDLAGALARVDATPTTGLPWWGNLDVREETELERLVEKALGERKFFEKRRRERAQEIRLELLGQNIEDPAAVRFLSEGAAGLPEAVLGDVFAGHLQAIDLAFLAVVVLTFATRTFAPQRERLLSWEDDGDTLVVAGRPAAILRDEQWADLDFGVGAFLSQLSGCAERLARAGWIVVDAPGPHPRQSRIRLGERLLEENGRR